MLYFKQCFFASGLLILALFTMLFLAYIINDDYSLPGKTKIAESKVNLVKANFADKNHLKELIQ